MCENFGSIEENNCNDKVKKKKLETHNKHV